MTMTTLVGDCKSTLQALAASPTFAMSLGAKELFHTNFLSFLLEIDATTLPAGDGKLVAETQRGLLALMFTCSSPASVVTWREKSGMDLIVLRSPIVGPAAPDGDSSPGFDSGGFMKRIPHLPGWKNADVGIGAVVLEAKLKALPTCAQLESYNGKLEKGVSLAFAEPLECGTDIWGRTDIRLVAVGTGVAEFGAYHVPAAGGPGNFRFAGARGLIRRILLAPDDPGKTIEGTGWSYLPWSVLAERLPDGVVCPGEGLMSHLLRDYGQSTRNLLHILAVTRAALEHFVMNNCPLTLGDLVTAVEHAAFKCIRIHDLIGKYAFNRIECELCCRLPSALRDSVGDFAFNSYTFMTRAKAGISFEYRLSHATNARSVSIGVQVQGSVYRHYVSASHPTERHGGWLRGLALLLGNPKSGNSADWGWWRVGCRELNQNGPCDFGQFGPEAFLYTHGSAADLTFAKLVAEVACSMTRVREALGSNAWLKFVAEANHFIASGKLDHPATSAQPEGDSDAG